MDKEFLYKFVNTEIKKQLGNRTDTVIAETIYEYISTVFEDKITKMDGKVFVEMVFLITSFASELKTLLSNKSATKSDYIKEGSESMYNIYASYHMKEFIYDGKKENYSN